MAQRDEFAEFIDLDGDLWDKILEEARKHVPKGSRRSTSRQTVAKPAAPKRATVRSDPVSSGKYYCQKKPYLTSSVVVLRMRPLCNPMLLSRCTTP